jgi:hypothetical protein
MVVPVVPTVINETDTYHQWVQQLSPAEQEEVLYVVQLLENAGVTLARPHSGSLKGTDLPLRELRPKAGASPLRVIYAFDPRREAVLLIGGDKGADKKMYKRLIPVAEQLWKAHVEAVKAELENEAKTKEKK